MCLAVPARIVEIKGCEATVDICGVRRTGNISFVENPQVGDFVLLHAGFAIQKWSQEDMEEYHRIVGDADVDPEQHRSE